MHFELHGTRNHVTNFEKCHIFTTLNPKIVFEKIKNCMLSNHEIWCIYVILYLHFVRKLLTFICQKMNDFLSINLSFI